MLSSLRKLQRRWTGRPLDKHGSLLFSGRFKQLKSRWEREGGCKSALRAIGETERAAHCLHQRATDDKTETGSPPS